MCLPLNVRRSEVVKLLLRVSQRCASGSDIVTSLQLSSGIEPGMVSDDFYSAMALLEGEKRLVFSLTWDYLESVAGSDLVEFDIDDSARWVERCARLAEWA